MINRKLLSGSSYHTISYCLCRVGCEVPKNGARRLVIIWQAREAQTNRNSETKRRTHSTEFKGRVSLEALKGIKTINQIVQDEGIHPVQVSTYKKKLPEKVRGARDRDPDQREPAIRVGRSAFR